MRKARTVLSIILILFSIFLIFECKKISRAGVIGTAITLGADFLPFWLSIIMFILAILLLFQSILSKKEDSNESLFPGYEGWKKIVYMMGGLFGYIILLEKIGFALTTLLYLYITMVLLNRRRIFVAMIVSLSVTFGLYCLFKLWLKISLPPGIIGV